MLTNPGSRKDAIFTADYILPLLQSNRKIFDGSPVGTASAEMFPWRQGTAERSSRWPRCEMCLTALPRVPCLLVQLMERTTKASPFCRNLILLEIKCLFSKENLKLCKLHKRETNKQNPYKHFTQISQYSSDAWGNLKAVYSWDLVFLSLGFICISDLFISRSKNQTNTVVFSMRWL